MVEIINCFDCGKKIEKTSNARKFCKECVKRKAINFQAEKQKKILRNFKALPEKKQLELIGITANKYLNKFQEEIQ